MAPYSKVEFFAVVSRSNNFQRVTLFARCDRVSLVWRNHPARRAGNVGGLVCSLPETQRNLIVTGAAQISVAGIALAVRCEVWVLRALPK